jgi:hypothetical protein
MLTKLIVRNFKRFDSIEIELGNPWHDDTKVSDDFLTPLFKAYFKRLGLYNVMDKKSFYELARFITRDRIDPEVRDKLEAIVRVSLDTP